MFKRISIILLVLSALLAFTFGASAALYVSKDADNTYLDYQDEAGVSIFKIDDDDGVSLSSKLAMTITTAATDPGRQVYWQFTSTAVASGKQLQGIQIKASWGGTANSTEGGITGAEIKARASSDSIVHELGQARAVVANVDCKKATFTVGYCVEAAMDIAAGGEITTGAGVRSFLNNSGTLGTGYAFLVEVANTSYNWDYGLYMASGQADVGIFLGGTQAIQFYDALVNIAAADDGDLVINADATLIVTSPAAKIIATTSLIHEFDSASYVTYTITDAGAAKVLVTGDSAGAYEIETDDGAIVLNAKATITLDAGTGDIDTADALVITPVAIGTYIDFELETEWVSGTLINADFGDTTLFSSAVIGVNLDLGTNVTATAEQNVKGIDINLPQMTVSDAAITAIGVEITATGAFAQTVGSASTWSGIEITTPTISEDVGTIVSTGVKITGGTLTSGNAYGVVLAGALTKAVYISGTTVTGIDIGTCTSYGILMDDTYVNAIRITTNVDTTAQTSIRVLNTYTANSGYHTAIMGAVILDSTAGTGSGAVIGVYGEANIQDTFTGATNWSYGVRGCLQLNDNTNLDNVGSIFGAVNAVLKDDPTPTITNAHIVGIYIDNLIDFDLSSATGISAMIYSANNASATCTMDYNWYIYGPKVTYLLGIYDGTVGGCVSETTNNEKHGGTIRHLKLDIDGTPYYLIVSTTPTT